MDEKIEELKKRLSALEEGLTEEDKNLARTELNAFIVGMNEDIEAYLVKMKGIGI